MAPYSITSSEGAKAMSRWMPDAIEQWSLTDQSRLQPSEDTSGLHVQPFRVSINQSREPHMGNPG
jgi:hypothetical protein